MKKIITLILICFATVTFAQNFDKDLVLYMPSMGGKTIVLPNAPIDNYLKDNNYTKQKSTYLSNSRVELEAAHGKHLRYSLQYVFNNGDTLYKNYPVAIINKTNMAQIRVGWSLRKNDWLEKLNLIPSVGLFYNNINTVKYNIIADNSNQKFDYKTTGSISDNTFGSVINVKLQYQLPPTYFSMLGIMVIGADVDYYSNWTPIANRTLQAGDMKVNGSASKNGYAYGLYCKFNLPIYYTGMYNAVRNNKTNRVNY